MPGNKQNMLYTGMSCQSPTGDPVAENVIKNVPCQELSWEHISVAAGFSTWNASHISIRNTPTWDNKSIQHSMRYPYMYKENIWTVLLNGLSISQPSNPEQFDHIQEEEQLCSKKFTFN